MLNCPRKIYADALAVAKTVALGEYEGEGRVASRMVVERIRIAGQAPVHPAELCIVTLGDFRVLEGPAQRSVTWSNRQCKSLLKYVLCAPGFRAPAEQVIDHLWPDVGPQRGREYLRRLVMNLRRSLEPERPAYGASRLLITDRESVALQVDRDADHSLKIDAYDFERLATIAMSGKTNDQDGARLADQALELYCGAFLPFDLYADWTKSPRQRYHRLWSGLIAQTARLAVSARAFPRATFLLGLLVDAVPDDEDAVYRLMVVYATLGRRGEALRLYERLQDELKNVHGATPTRAVLELRDAIREGRDMEDWIRKIS